MSSFCECPISTNDIAALHNFLDGRHKITAKSLLMLTSSASRSILTPDRSKDAIEHCCFLGNENTSFVSWDL